MVEVFPASADASTTLIIGKEMSTTSLSAWKIFSQRTNNPTLTRHNYKFLQKMPPNPSALPSYDWYADNNKLPRTTPSMSRIRWDPFSSPNLEKSIAVIEDATDAHSPEAPYSADHPIANQSICDPPVGSIEVLPGSLYFYHHQWMAHHLKHALESPKEHRACFQPRKKPDRRVSAHKWSLVCCCDTVAPPNLFGQPDDGDAAQYLLQVRASSTPFVTVNDYLTALNGYIRAHGDEILAAMGLSGKLDGPYPATDPGWHLYWWPTSISRPNFFSETKEEYSTPEMDWESLADYERARANEITVNYLYNTFPPELPTRIYTTYTYTRTVPGVAEPTVGLSVVHDDTIKGSVRKARENRFDVYLYGPREPKEDPTITWLEEKTGDGLTTYYAYSGGPIASMYKYPSEYCLTPQANVARFGTPKVCGAFRLDLFRGIGG
ncbi:hypothetical protein V8F06_014611 [Rhypophila decipiens]